MLATGIDYLELAIAVDCFVLVTAIDCFVLATTADCFVLAQAVDYFALAITVEHVLLVTAPSPVEGLDPSLDCLGFIYALTSINVHRLLVLQFLKSKVRFPDDSSGNRLPMSLNNF